jgi:hypothetical protein
MGNSDRTYTQGEWTYTGQRLRDGRTEVVATRSDGARLESRDPNPDVAEMQAHVLAAQYDASMGEP